MQPTKPLFRIIFVKIFAYIIWILFDTTFIKKIANYIRVSNFSQVVICPVPKELSHVAYMTLTLPRGKRTFNYGSWVTYRCDDGYRYLDGHSTWSVGCVDYGRWNATSGNCARERMLNITLQKKLSFKQMISVDSLGGA